MTMQDELQAKFEELQGLLHHGPSMEPLWQGIIKAIGELENGGSGDAGLANTIKNWETRIGVVEDEAKKYFAVLAATVQQVRKDVDDLKANQNAAAEHLDRLSRFVGTVVSRLDAAGISQLPPPAAPPEPVQAAPEAANETAPALTLVTTEPAAPEQKPVLCDPPTASQVPDAAGPANELLGA